MNLLRNVSELSRGTRLLKSLKRAEEYLFSVKELDSNGVTSVSAGVNDAAHPEAPTPVPSFKSLFQEEAKMLPSYLSQLNVASYHPVLGIARDFYGQNPSMPSLSPTLQLRAIFVLLIAKSIGLPRTKDPNDIENALLVDSKQKALSQITELLFAGHMLHRSVVDITDKTSSSSNGLHQGNKLATLMGDLLLAKTSRRLSELKNHVVTEIMSNTICEFSESGFIGEAVTATDVPVNPLPRSETQQVRESQGSDPANSGAISTTDKKEIVPDPLAPGKIVVGSRPVLTYPNWVERSRMSLGSIVGNSCVSCMVLAGHEDETTHRFASDLGRCIGILLQAYRDITVFEGEEGTRQETPEFVDPWTLPVILEAEQNAALIPTGLDITRMDHARVFETVQSSQSAMQGSKRVLANFQKKTINFLGQVEPSESVAIMLDILASMSLKTS